MKRIFKILSAITFLLSLHSQAAMVSVNAYAEMTDGLPAPTTMIPIGTGVTADVMFNIGSGSISNASFSNVSGEFVWLDSLLGEQKFIATSAHLGTTHSAGWFLLDFEGLGPTINGITAKVFSIQFNIGGNPFTYPNSTAELYELVLGSTIDRLRFGAGRSGTSYSDLESNVGGDISPVPLPSAFILFLSGVIGVFSTSFIRINNSNKAMQSEKPIAALSVFR